VLDWRDVLLHIGGRRHVPAPVTRLALAFIERLIAVDFDDLDWVRRAGEIDVPTLVVTGDDDLTVPYGRALALAEKRGDLVELELFAGAGHVGSWNLDPGRYEARIDRFLDTVLAAPD
jgi:fermentation-respiration switch protein FrsA (DUF1100 family)